MNNTQSQFTTVIGIDISKNKIDVADNQDSTVKTVGNNNKELTQWINSIADKTVTIVVMEATGGYESLLVALLHKNDIALAVVNPPLTMVPCTKFCPIMRHSIWTADNELERRSGERCGVGPPVQPRAIHNHFQNTLHAVQVEGPR